MNRPTLLRVFHRTSAANANAITESGFRDATASYGIGRPTTGVWLSTEPIGADEGADGDVLLSMKIPATLFAQFEWVDSMAKSFREAQIPAAHVNRFGPPRRVSLEAEDRLVTRLWRRRRKSTK
jgi:hypothetical protein